MPKKYKFETLDELRESLGPERGRARLKVGFVRRLAAFIKANGPTRPRYDQGHFATRDDFRDDLPKSLRASLGLPSIGEIPVENPPIDDGNVCRVAACLAGEALILAGLSPSGLYDAALQGSGSIQDTARRLLGLTYNQASNLFAGTNGSWPGQYNRNPSARPTKEKAARMLEAVADGRVKLRG